ncbi:MAG: RsmB/NOP family class I SAM-dependent RNA methyltransferase [Flavobacteriales bacterium]|nr:RsmB/NOP family class I SAM-dependent RNA methyltransferase [Flavobacteriales bacterium]
MSGGDRLKILPVHIHHAIRLYRSVLVDNKQSEDVWQEFTLENKQAGKRDRKIIGDTFYGLLRHRMLYQAILQQLNIPQNEYNMAGVHWALLEGFSGIHPCWPNLKADEVKYFLLNHEFIPEVLHSVPSWLYQLFPNELEWQALNQSTTLFLRINTLKATLTEVVSQLEKEKVDFEILSDVTLKINQKIQITKHPLYKLGYIEIQDFASQQVAPCLQVEPGMIVLDACAGGGGKSLHLASIMNNKGTIIATDIYQNKLIHLEQRAHRAGASIIQTSLIDDAFIQSHPCTFQRILTDVPCSGTGTLRRKPEIKWKLTPERLNELIQIQRSILINAINMLQPDGKLVYSTCSVLPNENEHQITWLLQKFPELKLETQQQIYPTEGGDGFFIARLCKGF